VNRFRSKPKKPYTKTDLTKRNDLLNFFFTERTGAWDLQRDRALGWRLGSGGAVAPAIVGGGGGVGEMRRGVARPVVEPEVVGDEEWRQNEGAKLRAPSAPAKTTMLVRPL